MKAIETRYKGYRFRSRLEARWAVFFDALELRWEYEREGYQLSDGTRYLPDFFVHWDAKRSARLLQFREVGYWVEIKGVEPSEEELRKLGALCKETGHIGYLLCGAPGELRAWVSGVNGTVKEWDHPHLSETFLAFVDCCPAVPATPERVRNAIAAARGARFEHGEVPQL